MNRSALQILRALARFHSCLLTVLLAVLCPTLPAQAASTLTEQVYVKSGLYAQASALPNSLGAGIVQSLGRTNAAPEQVERIRFEVVQSFSIEALRPVMLQTLEAGLTNDEMAQSLLWLDSGLGRKIHDVEESAVTPAMQEYIRFMAETLSRDSLDADRVRLLERLDSALKYTERSLDLLIAAQVAMAETFLCATGQEGTAGVDTSERERNRLARKLAPQLFANLFVTYMSLSDAELQGYILFARSRSGARFLEASSQAMLAAIEHGSAEFGRRVRGERVPRSVH